MKLQNLSDSYFWALSIQAQNTVKLLEEKGLDRDVALSLLETLFTESELYGGLGEGETRQVRIDIGSV